MARQLCYKSLAYWKKTQQIYKQLDIQDGMILGNLGNAYANLGKLDKIKINCLS